MFWLQVVHPVERPAGPADAAADRLPERGAGLHRSRGRLLHAQVRRLRHHHRQLERHVPAESHPRYVTCVMSMTPYITAPKSTQGLQTPKYRQVAAPFPQLHNIWKLLQLWLHFPLANSTCVLRHCVCSGKSLVFLLLFDFLLVCGNRQPPAPP